MAAADHHHHPYREGLVRRYEGDGVDLEMFFASFFEHLHQARGRLTYSVTAASVYVYLSRL
jgi:hypothetical protein